MAGDFFPRRDGELRCWSAHLAARLVAAPQDYGIAPQAAANYAELHQRYAEAFTRAADPSTRTRSAVEGKRQAKSALIEYLRRINACIKGRMGVTTQQHFDLGLNPRRRGGRSPRIPRPGAAPTVWVEEVRGRTAHVRLSDAQSIGRRGRPRGVKSAVVFRFAGPVAPSSISQWQYVTDTIHTRLDVRFPDDVPAGATVWVTAMWANRRGQSGALAHPVPCNLPGGPAMPETRRLRAA